MNFAENCIKAIEEEVKEAKKAKKPEDRLDKVRVIYDYAHCGFIFVEIDDYNVSIPYEKSVYFSEKNAKKLFMKCYFSNKRFTDVCRFIASRGMIF